MKSHLLFSDTKGMSRDEWLRFRKRGIGASDVGTILGMNQYKSNVELFYEKISGDLEYTFENIASFMGKEQEDFIADLWQYWEGTQESMIQNYRMGKIIRKCQRVNSYVQNPKYPWLFVSLDRKINKHDGRGEGSLEIKTIAGYEADKWEAGIPPSHIVQVQTQILVCEFGYGEIACQRDGRQFDVYPFDYNERICNGIIEKTKDFWDKVEKARILYTQRYEAQRSFNSRKVDECTHEIEMLEPEPDGSEAYEKFLKKRFILAEEGLVPGGDQEWLYAVEHRQTNEQIKQLQERQRELTNVLKRKIGDNNALDFGAGGRISWRKDENGVRRFLNKIKQ